MLFLFKNVESTLFKLSTTLRHKQMLNNKCSVNFQTQYCFIHRKRQSPKPVHVEEYRREEHGEVHCRNKHELVFVNGPKRRAHFRHKNPNDTGGDPITEWHCEWQGYFPYTEVPFHKKVQDQIKPRRADVHIREHDIVVEFQHSEITLDKVATRQHDYGIHSQRLVWIIDGNTGIHIKKLYESGRVYLEFVNEHWKYRSFTCHEYVFIDIDQQIYKIYPNDIKSDMIDVEPPLRKEDFIVMLKNNDPSLFHKNVPYQCQLYIKQQGAGNGKTYGLIQMLESSTFSHYRYFIIVSKQHSAKHVIYSEFLKQIEGSHLKYLEIVGDIEESNKKYIITFNNKNTGQKHTMVIATVDSFMYKIGNTNVEGVNKFAAVVDSIVDGYINATKKKMDYAGLSLTLNKEVCLICDETQDLDIAYAKAIYQIMRNRYIDAYIVGDALQSLVYKENAFTYLMNNEFSYIKKESYINTNICRRFCDKKLINFVNSVVPFEKYNLPKIGNETIRNSNLFYDIDDHRVVIFRGKDVFTNTQSMNHAERQKMGDKLNVEIQEFMNYYIREVETYDYAPNDFLIITPFTKNNPLCNGIETAINSFWNDRFDRSNEFDEESFKKYAVFHKSDEGSSIDLTLSENATRIVSVHTSKGDGRAVVFVVGLDEKSLLRFSKTKDNLRYDSLIHVAFTRMKRRLYIRLIENNDDIHQRLLRWNCDAVNTHTMKPSLACYNKRIKYDDIVGLCKTKEDFAVIWDKIIDPSDIATIEDIEKEKVIIDMGHHHIRYASMVILMYLKIIETQRDEEVRKQIVAVFRKISNKSFIAETYDWKRYNHVVSNKELCILRFSKKGRHEIYYKVIKDFMETLQYKIKCLLSGKNIQLLCPLESVILYFMIEICHSGIYSDTSIHELYDIIDTYANSFSDRLRGHDHCMCKKYFKKKSVTDDTHLANHYQELCNMGSMYDAFLQQHNDVNWLINHSISYPGQNRHFHVYKKFKLIGYNDSNVFNLYLKPQFNNLNYNETLLDSIFDTFLLGSLDSATDSDSDSDGNGDSDEDRGIENECLKSTMKG